MNQLSTVQHHSPPSPITRELETEILVCSNRLDPEGLGFTIAAEDAPSRAMRSALEARRAELGRSLAAIRSRGAAAEIMALSLILKARGKTAADAEATLDLYVKNLADLPAFAVVEACADYQQGRAGDLKWMPEVPEIRVRALEKCRLPRAERAQIERLLAAKVRAPRASPERRAETVGMARKLIEEMRDRERRGEAKRRGVAPEELRVAPETPTEALDRLKVENAASPVALSPEIRRAAHLAKGIDPAAWEEQQRIEAEYGRYEDDAA